MTLNGAAEMLRQGGIENARQEALVLFEMLLGLEPYRLMAEPDRDIQSDPLAEAVEKRASGYPLQYILGKWEFFGLELEVSEHCLCPRPDTEIAVERAIDLIPKNGSFLELCTGSGCIPVSLCKTRGDVCGVATDLFDETVAVARRNAVRHGVDGRCRFVRADLFCPDFFVCGEGKELVPPCGYDAIISNPPYIPTGDLESLSREVKHEPRAALDGGEDGLDFYRVIVRDYGRFLAAEGAMILEIGYDQGEALRRIAGENGYDCRIVKDLGGNDRVAELRRSIY